MLPNGRKGIAFIAGFMEGLFMSRRTEPVSRLYEKVEKFYPQPDEGGIVSYGFHTTSDVSETVFGARLASGRFSPCPFEVTAVEWLAEIVRVWVVRGTYYWVRLRRTVAAGER